MFANQNHNYFFFEYILAYCATPNKKTLHKKMLDDDDDDATMKMRK